MQNNATGEFRYTQNRELSWLRFNRRVLEEALDTSVPALERLKFISIFSNNLDEFFMVRVGSLYDISRITPDDTDNKTGWTAIEQLRHIYDTIPSLLGMKRNAYEAVMAELGHSGIKDISCDELMTEDVKVVNRFFKNEILPILSPILIGPNHPVPHLVNKRLYAVASLKNKKGTKALGVVPIPDNIPPYLILSDRRQYVRVENIVTKWLPMLFDAYDVEEYCVLSVTRNADISFDEDKFEDRDDDFRHQMKKLLKKRDHLAVMRLELNREVSVEFQKKLAALVRVETQQIFVDTCPLNMRFVFQLIGDFSTDITNRLTYEPFYPKWHTDIRRDISVLQQIQQQDRLLFYPYDSVEPFLKLLNEAADNPQVLSIKITIYRLASLSKIAQTLCRAADNGKEVLVLMELRARFDEENNLAWSKMLEESGCQVIYGTDGFKCHSKLCLITLRNHNKTTYITQIGTGNYNEKTNAMYTDFSLMTANQDIGGDAAAFFRNMLVNKLDGEYKELCVSPFGIKQMLIRKINGEIAKGKNGYICIKANSVTEREIIDKLSEASCAGVEIRLIIRGICCILPEIPGFTENIHVTSLVGRYLEHGRIYQFGKDNEAEFYISSADLMTRNLNRRVEIACPVYEKSIRDYISRMLDSQLKDTVKASVLLSDGSYSRKKGVIPFDSQKFYMEELSHIPCESETEAGGLFFQIRRRLGIMKSK